MKLTFAYDRTLPALRQASMLSLQPGIDSLAGTLALENGKDLIALTGDLFLLTRELLDGLNRLIGGHTPKLLLMGETEAWELGKLGNWVVIKGNEGSGFTSTALSASGVQGSGTDNRKTVGRIRGHKLKVARAALKGAGELMLQLFAINSQLELVPAVAEIRKAHQRLSETVEAIAEEPLGRKLERWKNELLVDRWKAATVGLAIIVLLQCSLTLGALRKGNSTTKAQRTQRTTRNLNAQTQRKGSGFGVQGSGTETDTSLMMGPPLPVGWNAGLGVAKTGGPSNGVYLPPALPTYGPLSGKNGRPTDGRFTMELPNPTRPPALPKLVGTLETSASSAALFEDGNTVEVYSVGSQAPGGWLVTRVENGTVSLAHGEGRQRIIAQVSLSSAPKSGARG